MTPVQMKIPSTVRVKAIWIPKSWTSKFQTIKLRAMKTMRVTRKELMFQLMIIATTLQFCNKKNKR